MKITWICATWGMTGVDLAANMKMAKDAGFDGIETGVPEDEQERSHMRSLLKEMSLGLVAQQWTRGVDAAGHAEAPQVPDPRAEEWRPALEAHLRWWQRIVDRRKESGASALTICPEFGPAP